MVETWRAYPEDFQFNWERAAPTQRMERSKCALQIDKNNFQIRLEGRLESYGYKFLRINRFNLGPDPVTTLSERLYALIDAATKEEDAAVVTKIRDGADGLSKGTAKHCRKCEQVKPMESFFDQKLRGGQGGYGQICMDCKIKGAASAESAPRKKRIRRYWRRWYW
jgi:hypothetical protein